MPSAMDLISTDEELKDHWVKRVIAIIIDYIIVSIPFSILAFFALSLPYTVIIGSQGAFFFVYFLITELTMGASIGKKLMNLKVIAITGELDVMKILIRNISKIVGVFFLIDFLIGFFTEGDPKQKFTDRYAGTTVVLADAPFDQSKAIYQTQQNTPQAPPQQYPQQNTTIYQQPPPPPPQAPPAPEQGKVCTACQGTLIMTGDGRHQCIRCGKMY
ncbi:MAG: RDD family protein [Thermoplasmata archaeon]|nr:RDD family protein [Thermoplasmata archaeon]